MKRHYRRNYGGSMPLFGRCSISRLGSQCNCLMDTTMILHSFERNYRYILASFRMKKRIFNFISSRRWSAEIVDMGSGFEKSVGVQPYRRHDGRLLPGSSTSIAYETIVFEQCFKYITIISSCRKQRLLVFMVHNAEVR